VDLGDVKSGLPLTHSFELINDSPEAVEILETRASCGCLIGKVEPRIIPAGERAALVLRMHTLGQAAGPHSWKATLRYRHEGVEKETTVGISVRLVTEVTVQPATLTLITEGILDQLVTLTDRRSEPLKVVGVQTSTTALQARLLDQGQGSAHIQLETGQTLAPGRHEEILTIDTDDPGYRQLQVPVTIIKTSRTVTALPARVELQTRAGESASCLVRLCSGSDEVVTISKIEAGHPALTCRWAPGPANQATVKIQLDPGQWTGHDLESTVTIHLAGSSKETLTIPVFVHRVQAR
jgi:hypothetical protein